jgi:hypothetical protein
MVVRGRTVPFSGMDSWKGAFVISDTVIRSRSTFSLDFPEVK